MIVCWTFLWCQHDMRACLSSIRNITHSNSRLTGVGSVNTMWPATTEVQLSLLCLSIGGSLYDCQSKFVLALMVRSPSSWTRVNQSDGSDGAMTKDAGLQATWPGGAKLKRCLLLHRVPVYFLRFPLIIFNSFCS